MGELGIDIGLLIAQLVSFFLLLAILRLVLYKPVRQTLHARRERIAKGLADAEAAAKRAEQAEAEYQKRLESAQREAQAILAEAKEAARKESEAIIARGRAEVEQMRVLASRQIEQERHEALTALHAQIADLAIEAASKVLGQSMDSVAQRRLVNDFLFDLERGR